MKKVVYFLLLLLLLVVVYVSFSSSSKEQTQVVAQSDMEQFEDELNEKDFLEDFSDLNEENLSVDDIEKSLVLTFVTKEIEPKMVEDEVKDIMVETDMADVEKVFPSKEGITPMVAIEMPKNSIKKLNIGDTVSLPNMGNGQFDAKITSKTTHKNGSVSVTGNLVDSGTQYSVVLTEGKNMTFGTVTTPNGSFEIEAKNGQGYVYATSDIDKGWIDYGKEDVLVPTE